MNRSTSACWEIVSESALSSSPIVTFKGPFGAGMVSVAMEKDSGSMKDRWSVYFSNAFGTAVKENQVARTVSGGVLARWNVWEWRLSYCPHNKAGLQMQSMTTEQLLSLYEKAQSVTGMYSARNSWLWCITFVSVFLDILDLMIFSLDFKDNYRTISLCTFALLKWSRFLFDICFIVIPLFAL